MAAGCIRGGAGGAGGGGDASVHLPILVPPSSHQARRVHSSAGPPVQPRPCPEPVFQSKRRARSAFQAAGEPRVRANTGPRAAWHPPAEPRSAAHGLGRGCARSVSRNNKARPPAVGGVRSRTDSPDGPATGMVCRSFNDISYHIILYNIIYLYILYFDIPLRVPLAPPRPQA